MSLWAGTLAFRWASIDIDFENDLFPDKRNTSKFPRGSISEKFLASSEIVNPLGNLPNFYTHCSLILRTHIK